MKSRLLASWLTVALLVAACGDVDPAVDGSDTTAPPGGVSTTAPPGRASTTVPPGGEAPVFVDATEIVYLESFPVQARLVVRGSLPTPCHDPRWTVEDLGWMIDVGLWSEADPARTCIQVLAPLDVSIPLGSFESATTPVMLNGEEIGRLAIGAEPGAEVLLVAAGWSFGMCGGYCNADLAVDGDELVLTGRSRMTDEPLYVNSATLTPEALSRLDAAAKKLRGVELVPVYGCPDCADGGAAYLTLARGGITSRHDMDFGRPPDVLAEMQGLATAMIDALEACESSELLIVADDCEPRQGF